jgi:hypothetical protein
MYNIEILEDRLRATMLGRSLVDLIELHLDEVSLLVNQNRHVIVVWHRNHGPQFMGSIIRSGFEKGYEFEREIYEIKLDQMIRRMAAVLQEQGTPALRQVIGDYIGRVLVLYQQAKSLEDVFEWIRAFDAGEGKQKLGFNN